MLRTEHDILTNTVIKNKSLQDVCSQKPDAQNLWGKYQECNDRVNSRSQTAETCEQELVDYLHVLDKCVSKDLFKRLK